MTCATEGGLLLNNMAKGHVFLGYAKPDKDYIEQVRLANKPVDAEDLTVPDSPVGHEDSLGGDPDQGGG